MSLQVCVAVDESHEYYSVTTCTTALQFSKSYMYGSFCAVYCHMLFRLCDTTNRYDTTNSHLTQMIMCATFNAKTMLLNSFSAFIS